MGDGQGLLEKAVVPSRMQGSGGEENRRYDIHPTVGQEGRMEHAMLPLLRSARFGDTEKLVPI